VLGIIDSGNHLFTLARRGQRFPSAPAAVAVVPALLVVMIAVQVAMRGVLRSLLGDGQTADSIAELLGFSSIFGGLWCLLRFWIRRPIWTLGFERPGSLKWGLRGAVVAALMMGATAALLVHGATVGRGEIQSRGFVALGGGLLSLLATTVQSSAEEALFRGWLFQVLGARYGAFTGLTVSSLVFTLAHVTTGPPLIGWVNLYLFALMAALFTLAEGGLWGAAAWHTSWNWMQGSLLGFAVDRSVRPGMLASIRTNGPEYITGGSFGPEGGLAVTAILLAGITILAIRNR
jgi:membrane protease YdiL (CAAX protease family)